MRLHQPVPLDRQPHLGGGIPHIGMGGGRQNWSQDFPTSGIPSQGGGAGISGGAGIPETPGTVAFDDGGMVAETGTVDPNAYLRWPNQVATAGTGFEDGGQVDPNAFLDPMAGGNNTQALAEHASQVYQDYHKQLEQEWTNANQARGSENFGDTGNTPDQSFKHGGGVRYDYASQDEEIAANDLQSEREQAANDAASNYAAGGEVASNNEGTGDEGPPEPPAMARGGIPPGPGPAGAGVTPKPAKSPQQAIDRNFYQDQSSRQFTSPSVGTSFTQPGPRGGQRGQEWYGKGRGNGRR